MKSWLHDELGSLPSCSMRSLPAFFAEHSKPLEPKEILLKGTEDSSSFVEHLKLPVERVRG